MSDDEKRRFRQLMTYYMKMKFKQVIHDYRSVHQSCSSAAHRFQLASISYWSSVVQTIFGGVLRLL